MRVNGLTNTIQSMTRDADHKIYLIEVADEIVYGERVTLSYNKRIGKGGIRHMAGEFFGLYGRK